MKGNNKRPYQTYDANDLEAALKEVGEGTSLRKASAKYGISLATLSRKSRGLHDKKPGAPPVLTDAEEETIASTVQQVTAWGYGFSKSDFRLLIKSYLDSNHRSVSRFKNNLPGIDFVNSFCRRRNFTMRKPGNIKVARASISSDDITGFFDNLATAGDIAPENMFNFDETCVADDPGAAKVLVQRGTRRVELVKEHSKTNISIMACGSATGELLPPMFCYKAQNLYEGWTRGGPSGAVYAVTKSGWFEMNTFKTWFVDVFLATVRNRPGRKLLVGDNLASHFSPRVMQLAKEHDIYFTALPPNATHILQPLDVSVFHPMKLVWKEILDNFRKESRNRGSFPKEHFPIMLSELWHKMKLKNVASNLISGFRCTGLHPLNAAEPLKRLPGGADLARGEIGRKLDNVLVDLLKKNRGQGDNQEKKKRGPKILPGLDLASETEVAGPSGMCASAGPSQSTGSRGRCRAVVSEDDESDEDSDEENYCFSCHCDNETYTGPDWLQCTRCHHWICGKCNKRSRDIHFQCEECRK